jgi:hypothetical protein
LDRELMTNERTASNRAMISITSLPLLTTTEAKKILRRCIPEHWEFEDVNALEVQRDFALEILAVASSGHPCLILHWPREAVPTS